MHSPIFSLEVFPPKRTSPVGTIYDTLDGLQGWTPTSSPSPTAPANRPTAR